MGAFEVCGSCSQDTAGNHAGNCPVGRSVGPQHPPNLFPTANEALNVPVGRMGDEIATLRAEVERWKKEAFAASRDAAMLNADVNRLRAERNEAREAHEKERVAFRLATDDALKAEALTRETVRLLRLDQVVFTKAEIAEYHGKRDAFLAKLNKDRPELIKGD